MAGVFTVSAHHVSYDLSGTIITNGVATDIAGACEVLQGAAQGYTIATNKGTIAPFKISEPSSVRSWFGGKAGSLLDVYGGEWHWDNTTFAHEDRIGNGTYGYWDPAPTEAYDEEVYNYSKWMWWDSVDQTQANTAKGEHFRVIQPGTLIID